MKRWVVIGAICTIFSVVAIEIEVRVGDKTLKRFDPLPDDCMRRDNPQYPSIVVRHLPIGTRRVDIIISTIGATQGRSYVPSQTLLHAIIGAAALGGFPSVQYTVNPTPETPYIVPSMAAMRQRMQVVVKAFDTETPETARLFGNTPSEIHGSIEFTIPESARRGVPTGNVRARAPRK